MCSRECFCDTCFLKHMKENPYEKHIPVQAELAKGENVEEHLSEMRNRKAHMTEFLTAEKGNLEALHSFRSDADNYFKDYQA
jgi:hypothetical protein